MLTWIGEPLINSRVAPPADAVRRRPLYGQSSTLVFSVALIHWLASLGKQKAHDIRALGMLLRTRDSSEQHITCGCAGYQQNRASCACIQHTAQPEAIELLEQAVNIIVVSPE